MAKQQAAYLMGPLNFCPICGFSVNGMGESHLATCEKTVGDFVDWAKKHQPAMVTEMGSTKKFVGKKTITTWKKLRGEKPVSVKRKIKLFKNVPVEQHLCGFCRQQLTDNMVEFLNPGVHTTGETPIGDIPLEPERA
jgi:hypothetical protein